MKRKIAFIFPGQGAQYVGMGKDFAAAFPVAKETFQEADELLHMPLSRIIFEGPEELLVQTKHSQLAILVTSFAFLRVLQNQLTDLTPFVCAGLSLGEYTALLSSQKIGFAEVLSLVQKRAQFMQEACEKMSGTMAAILGLEGHQVEEGLRGIPGVWVANYNCPGQVVISGTKEGVEKGGEALKAKGAKRVLPLSVSGAFHSPLMELAQTSLQPYIEQTPLRDSPSALVMNVSGQVVESKEEIRKHLISQVTQSVRWEHGIRAIDQRGCDLYLEIGCGKTLSGMNRKIGVKGITLSLEKVADLELIAKEAATCNC